MPFTPFCSQIISFCAVLQTANSDLTPLLSSFLQWWTAEVLILPTTESLLLPAPRLGLLSCTHVRRATPYKAATTPSVRQVAGGQRNQVARVSVHAPYTCVNRHSTIYMALLIFKSILLLYIPSLCWDVLVSYFSMIFSFILLTVVDCGTPEMPTNGAIDLRSTTFDSTVQYACNTGYSLVGQNTSVCQADGEWSSGPPSCEGEWRSASTHTHTHTHTSTHTHTHAHTDTHSEVSVLWLL